MTAVFADTFFLVAAANIEDPSHAAALEILRRKDRRFVTTFWVLTELADALAARTARSAFADILQLIRNDPLFQIVPLALEHWEQGVQLYRRRPDKDWSLTDCISFHVMREKGLTAALTGDRHFEQAGFTALLKRN